MDVLGIQRTRNKSMIPLSICMIFLKVSKSLIYANLFLFQLLYSDPNGIAWINTQVEF